MLTHANASVKPIFQPISSLPPDSPIYTDLPANLGMPGKTQIASRVPNTKTRTGALKTSTGATF